MNTEKINELARIVMEEKEREDYHKQLRMMATDELAAMIATKVEGTDKAATDMFTVTVTSKLTRTLDYPAYLAVEQKLPVGLRCVVMKPEIDLKKLRALELANQEIPAGFVTTKPARSSIKIEKIEVQDGN